MFNINETLAHFRSAISSELKNNDLVIDFFR
jgi:hypothetical protein